VLDEGFEGFVVRTDGTTKVKPVHTFDLAVVGFVSGPPDVNKTYTDSGGSQVKTLVLAWLDEEGIYRYACNCGNGVTTGEQKKLADMLNPLVVDEDYRLGKYLVHMVRPQLVVEVACGQVLPPREAMSWQWTGSNYKDTGPRKTAALRFPKFIPGPKKFRTDKSGTNWKDCRIQQIPTWGPPTSPRPVSVPSAVVDEPGTAKPKPKPEVAKAVEPKTGGFVVGQRVRLVESMPPLSDEGEVQEVYPPKGQSPSPTYLVKFDQPEDAVLEMGESKLAAIKEETVEEADIDEKAKLLGTKSEPDKEDSDAVWVVRPLF